MKYYKRLRTTRILNLDSASAVKTNNSAGNVVSYEWDMPYTLNNLSNNCEMRVRSLTYNNANAGDNNLIITFRCPQVNSECVYDAYRGNGSIIYHMLASAKNKTVPDNLVYKMILPLNKITITASNDITDRDNGLNSNDKFMFSLEISDYDLEEVQPLGMPLMEDYHKYPQMVIKY